MACPDDSQSGSESSAWQQTKKLRPNGNAAALSIEIKNSGADVVGTKLPDGAAGSTEATSTEVKGAIPKAIEPSPSSRKIVSLSALKSGSVARGKTFLSVYVYVFVNVYVRVCHVRIRVQRQSVLLL